jgi:AcrR family transcriptional regulator
MRLKAQRESDGEANLPRAALVAKSKGRSADAEASRANILDVALIEFADKGFSGARIDEIAEKTNTSKRMIYYHFGSKEGLYQAVLDKAYGGIRQTETTMSIDSADAEQILADHVRLTFDYHNSHPEFVRLVMNENILHGAFIKNVGGIKHRRSSIEDLLGTIIEKGQTEGFFRQGIDPIDLHMTISALSFYNVSNRYTFSRIFDRDMTTPAAVASRREQVVQVVLAWCRR